jgi:hypothetical protein
MFIDNYLNCYQKNKNQSTLAEGNMGVLLQTFIYILVAATILLLGFAIIT